MRTNIVLDEDLLREAMRYSDARSKRRLVEEALRTFVEVKSTERRRQAYDERLRELEPRLRALRLKVPPTEVLRADRERDA
jgi:Arc/MetJ family transcription regulator